MTGVAANPSGASATGALLAQDWLVIPAPWAALGWVDEVEVGVEKLPAPPNAFLPQGVEQLLRAGVIPHDDAADLGVHEPADWNGLRFQSAAHS